MYCVLYVIETKPIGVKCTSLGRFRVFCLALHLLVLRVSYLPRPCPRLASLDTSSRRVGLSRFRFAGIQVAGNTLGRPRSGSTCSGAD